MSSEPKVKKGVTPAAVARAHLKLADLIAEIKGTLPARAKDEAEAYLAAADKLRGK